MSKRKISDLLIPVFNFEKSIINPNHIIPDPPSFLFDSKSTSSNPFSGCSSLGPMSNIYNPLSKPEYASNKLFKSSNDTPTISSSKSSHPNKKIKMNDEMNGIIIKTVQIEKSKEKTALIYSFKIHYRFDSLRYISNRIINVSTSKLKNHLINYVLFKDIKHFIKKLYKNESCAIKLDNDLIIIYSKDTSEWVHNIKSVDTNDRITIRIPMDENLLDHFANTLKENIVDKINLLLNN